MGEGRGEGGGGRHEEGSKRAHLLPCVEGKETVQYLRVALQPVLKLL